MSMRVLFVVLFGAGGSGVVDASIGKSKKARIVHDAAIAIF